MTKPPKPEFRLRSAFYAASLSLLPSSFSSSQTLQESQHVRLLSARLDSPVDRQGLHHRHRSVAPAPARHPAALRSSEERFPGRLRFEQRADSLAGRPPVSSASRTSPSSASSSSSRSSTGPSQPASSRNGTAPRTPRMCESTGEDNAELCRARSVTELVYHSSPVS